MAIIRWNPWSLSNIFDEEGLDVPTLPGFSRLGQGLNIYETNNSLVAEAALPGVDPDTIDVTVDKGIVQISGSMQQEEEDKKRYYMNSLTAAYNYSFRLPKDIAANTEPEADYDNGILRLSFQKEEKPAPKKIRINASKKQSSHKEEKEAKQHE